MEKKRIDNEADNHLFSEVFLTALFFILVSEG